MKGKTSKLIFNIVTWIAVAAVIVFAVVNIAVKASGNVFFLFGRANLFVVTESMSPTIPENTYIVIENVDPKDVKIGDVITFYSEDPTIYGRLNTHRVKEIETSQSGKLTFITKGDHNVVADGYTVSEDKLVGRYVRNSPIMTYIGRFFMSVGGLIVMMLMISGMAVFTLVPAVLRKNADKIKEKNEKEKQMMIDALVKAEVEKMRSAAENGLANDDQTLNDPSKKE